MQWGEDQKMTFDILLLVLQGIGYEYKISAKKAAKKGRGDVGK